MPRKSAICRRASCVGTVATVSFAPLGQDHRVHGALSGKTKAAVVDKLRDLHLQLDKGITPKAGYAITPFGRPPRTGSPAGWTAAHRNGQENQNVLEPILTVIGTRKLRELTGADVRQALAAMAAGYSTAAVTMGHLAFKRAIRHTEANDLVARNVAILADTPRPARPSIQVPDPGPGRGSHHRRQHPSRLNCAPA